MLRKKIFFSFYLKIQLVSFPLNQELKFIIKKKYSKLKKISETVNFPMKKSNFLLNFQKLYQLEFLKNLREQYCIVLVSSGVVLQKKNFVQVQELSFFL